MITKFIAILLTILCGILVIFCFLGGAILFIEEEYLIGLVAILFMMANIFNVRMRLSILRKQKRNNNV